jgi:hypothetical protein
MTKQTKAKKAQEYDNTNTGCVWPNKFTTWRKNPETGKDEVVSPELTGFIDIEGVEYKLAAWPVKSDNPKAPAWRFKVTPQKHEEEQETDQFVEGVAKAK